MELIIIITGILFIISVINLIICLDGGKIYCSIYERKTWKNWEKVIRNCNTIKYIESFNYPELAGLKFSMIVDGEELKINYWTRATDYPGFAPCLGITNKDSSIILTKFDKYHHDIMVNILREKFDFFPL